MNDDAELLKLTNSTGFVFQIGVRQHIERTFGDHHWEVVGQEHRWDHHLTKQSSFADLVLSHTTYIFRIVIECKRATDREWVFLTPSDSSRSRDRTSAFIFFAPLNTQGGGGWLDFGLQPPSPESAFCVVRGQDERNTPMLERVADSLLPSTEAIAYEEAYLNRTKESRVHPLVIPVLVTNASLVTCAFDPGKVDLAEGRVSAAEFTKVDLVRFRKGLTTNYPGTRVPESLRQANQYGERTMLVVNAAALGNFLAGFRPDPNLGRVVNGFIEASRHARP